MKEECQPTKAYYAKCEVPTSLGKMKGLLLCALLFGEEDSLPSYFYGDTIGQSSEQNMPSEALLLLPVSAEEVKASLPNSLTPEVPSELSQPYLPF
ncbi:15207_t:CDS:2 [Dentiscutata heterogama]|uniref:15207_t:CDS:1 n=1 Tax=Dentiscutata heterogama TaxID=1316150 RepID=A0ACA9NUY7_9GLOM|nr:15207_t:CDS:2 [Dentiscutata heterogama]